MLEEINPAMLLGTTLQMIWGPIVKVPSTRCRIFSHFWLDLWSVWKLGDAALESAGPSQNSKRLYQCRLLLDTRMKHTSSDPWVQTSCPESAVD